MSGIFAFPIAWMRASITGNNPDFGFMLFGGSGVLRIALTLHKAIDRGPALIIGVHFVPGGCCLQRCRFWVKRLRGRGGGIDFILSA